MSLIINLGVFSGLSRFYNEYEDKHRIKNIAITFSLLWGSACIAVFIIFKDFFANLFFNSDTNGINGMSVGTVNVRKELQTIPKLSEYKTIQWTGDGTQSYRVYLPKGYDSRIPSPLAICFHGNGSNETFWSTNTNMLAMQRALVNAGYIVLACCADGYTMTWGHEKSINAYYQAYKYVKNNYSIGSVVFYANSMGSIESLITLSQNLIPCVAWVGTSPTYDLRNNYDTNFKTTIDNSYGITDEASYTTLTAGRDPALMSAFAFRCLPMFILSALDDTAVFKAYNADKLAEKVNGIALELKTIDVASGGHSFPIAPYTSQIVDFFNKYVQ
jgi:hypothetical protein